MPSFSSPALLPFRQLLHLSAFCQVTMVQLTRAEKHARLIALAQDQNISMHKLRPLFQVKHQAPSFETANDSLIADKLLAEQEASKQHGKPFFPTRGRMANYMFKNATAVLRRLVDSNGSAGVAQALLRKGGDLKVVKNKETRRGQAEARNALLAIAVNNECLGLTELLASSAGPSHLNHALGIAITKRNATLVQTLLEYRADPNHSQQAFHTASSSGDLLIVELLLRAPVPLAKETLRQAANAGVVSGALDVVNILANTRVLDSPQDVDLLKRAVEDGRCDILIVLLRRASSLRAAQLDRLVSSAFENVTISMPQKHQMIECLLCAGASGENAARVLVKCVQKNSRNLVDLLVRHGASIDWGRASAVRYAAMAGDVIYMKALLSSNSLTDANATHCVESLPSHLDPDIRHQILQLLITAGAPGVALDTELLSAVKNRRVATITMLLAHGASPNRLNGASFIAAIESGQVPVLQQLLRTGATLPVLQLAFPSLQRATKLPRRLMMQQLIAAGASGEVVDEALRDAVCDYSDNRDDQLINTLIDAGASAGWNRAESCRSAISNGDTSLLLRLLSGPNKLAVRLLSTLMEPTMRHSERETRNAMMGHIVTAGATGPSLDQVLCDILSQPEPDVELLDLLISRGSVNANHRNGEAVSKAATNCEIGIFQKVIQIPGIWKSSWASALSQTLKLPGLSDRDRSARVGLLLQNKYRKDLATQGLQLHLKHCSRMQTIPFDWNLLTLDTLLEAGADVNADGGFGVKTLATMGALPALDALLRWSPSTATLNAALPNALKLSDSNACLKVCELLLKAGMSGLPIDDALLETNASQVQQSGLDQSLLDAVLAPNPEVCDLLLDYGASPSYKDGEPIREAARLGEEYILKILLKACPTPGSLRGTHTALLCAARMSSNTLCNMLLQHQASLDFEDHEAMKVVVSNGRVDILTLFLSVGPSHEAIAAAFQASKKLNPEIRYDITRKILGTGFRDEAVDAYLVGLTNEKFPDKRLVALLLDHDTSVHYRDNECMRTATTMLHLDILRSYFRRSKKRNVATQCLSVAAGAGLVKENNIEMLQFLLEQGAAGEVIDQVLVDVVTATRLDDGEFRLIDLLLSYGANVNYENGEALWQACRIGNRELIAKILDYSPCGLAKSRAFAQSLMSETSDKSLMETINAFTTSPGDAVDYDHEVPEIGTMLQVLLTRRPNSVEVLGQMLNSGCPVCCIPPLRADLSDEEQVQSVKASNPVLFWALSQTDPVISSPCLSMLIQRGGKC